MEKYNLTWHSYTDHLKQMLQSLMNDKDSQDVTLVCDDKVKIKAHKFVLRSCRIAYYWSEYDLFRAEKISNL